MYVERNTEKRSRKYCCRAKAINITYSEYENVALIVQHAMRMRRIVTYDLSGAITFFTISLKRHNFRIKVIGHKTFRLSPHILSETFLILR